VGDRLALDVGWPEAEEVVEVIHGRER